MINRREFINTTLGSIITSNLIARLSAQALNRPVKIKSTVALLKTSDRASGVQRVIDLLGINPIQGKNVLLKPNFNTADPFPASTHNDTAKYLILKLKSMGAKSITIGERSGPVGTEVVLESKGIYDLCRALNVQLINFEELPPEEWINIQPDLSHWKNGFKIAKPVLDAECIVTTCCLKTHRYGGVFTMSLKLSVGMVHKQNMRELHTSFINMRNMIAEINQAYEPSLILLDGIEAFVDGGPAKGTRKKANALLAGTDRIAIDAVGLAILKKLGSNKAIMNKRIFKQDQIARAAELGLGVSRPQDINIITDDGDSQKYADKLLEILDKG